MPKYKVTQTQIHRVDLVFTEEFDTNDANKWNELRDRVREKISDDDFNSLPSKPPKNVKLWLELYRHIDSSYYENATEKWVSHSRGGYPIEYSLSDDKGNIIDTQ